MNFDPVSDARSERAKARAAIAEKNVKQSDFESQFQAAFNSSSLFPCYWKCSVEHQLRLRTK